MTRWRGAKPVSIVSVGLVVLGLRAAAAFEHGGDPLVVRFSCDQVLEQRIVYQPAAILKATRPIKGVELDHAACDDDCYSLWLRIAPQAWKDYADMVRDLPDQAAVLVTVHDRPFMIYTVQDRRFLPNPIDPTLPYHTFLGSVAAIRAVGRTVCPAKFKDRNEDILRPGSPPCCR